MALSLPLTSVPQRRDEALLQHKAEEAREKDEAGKGEQQPRLGLIGEEHARDDDAASAEEQDAKVLRDGGGGRGGPAFEKQNGCGLSAHETGASSRG